MEAPDVFAGYGKITDTDFTDFGFHIDDLLNISSEEIAGPIGVDDNSNDSSSNNNTKWTGDATENSSSQRCRSLFYGNYDAEIQGYYTLTCGDDLAELEWLSNFAEDSFSMDNGEREPPNNNIEEIGSSAGPEMCGSVVPVRARSKRPRIVPVGGNWYNSRVLFNTRRSPSGLEIDGHLSNNSSLPGNGPKDQCSVAETAISTKKFANAKRYGTMRLKKAQDENGGAAQTTRRCMHCGIQRTPQWRAGPLGPKTLCNACGVRYKSGRLFPEYRPAASPTFVLSQHSNSHKRVLQMRRQKFESPLDEELGEKTPILQKRCQKFESPVDEELEEKTPTLQMRRQNIESPLDEELREKNSNSHRRFFQMRRQKFEPSHASRQSCDRRKVTVSTPLTYPFCSAELHGN